MTTDVSVPRQTDYAHLFRDPVWAEVYAAYCCDAHEAPTMESARGFRDALLSQNCDRKPLRLSLRAMRIGPVSVSCLGLQLKDRPYTFLDLSENMLGDDAALSFRSLIRALPHLKSLYVVGNLMTLEGAQELSEELEANTTLEVLALGGSPEASLQGRVFRPNAIGSEGVRCLASALAQNPNNALTSLNLCRTSLGPEAGRYLASLLEHDEKLVNLDVSCNPLQSEGTCALLSRSSRLRNLNIGDTHCRGELVHPQLDSLMQRTRALVRLSLAHNALQARPLRRIARGVTSCESLVSLDLAGTSIGTEGVTVLVDALLEAPVKSLTELDLSDNKLSQVDAAVAIAQVIKKYNTLLVLRLCQNPFGDRGIMELVNALHPDEAPDCSLQCLDLSKCRVGTSGASQLLSCLIKNENLRSLRLGDNFLDDSLDLTLVDQLEHVHELHLIGNRLSHATFRHCALVATRNRQRTRDEEPSTLRTEMHRLLFQETKLEKARKQVDKDEAEVKERVNAIERALEELDHLRTTEAENQRQLANRIESEELDLKEKEQFFETLVKKLTNSTMYYNERQKECRDELLQREEVLAELQVESATAVEHYERRQKEHPRELESIRQRTTAALDEVAQLKEQANTMRLQQKTLQDKSLIDFKC